MVRSKFIIAITLLFFACNNEENSANGLNGVYHEYLIALGESDIHKIQVVATFRKGDDFGKPLSLPAGYSVYLDSTPIALDTAVYPTYSIEIDRKGFVGEHNWRVLQNERELLNIPFSFKTFTLTTPIDSVLGKKDIQLGVAGLSAGDTLECWFDNIDVDNAIDRFYYPVNDNQIIIPASDLKKLTVADYKLVISFTKERPVILKNNEVGKSEVSYILGGRPVRINY
jgi:hypothetical protein